jgi:hypothetical protein
MNDVTRLLSALDQGDPHAASRLLPLVYDELRELAAQRMEQKRLGRTPQPTAFVHEANVQGGAAAPTSRGLTPSEAQGLEINRAKFLIVLDALPKHAIHS